MQYHPIKPTPGYDLRPEQVSGYEQAKADGLVPTISSVPPVMVRPSAHQAILVFIVKFFAAIAVAIFFMKATDRGDASVLKSLFMAAFAIGISYYIYASWMTYIKSMLKELLLGYTTSPFIVGGTKLYSTRRWKELPPRSIPWKYSGIWTLDSQGSVISPPDGVTPAPGIYPSPTKEGKWELWTGAVWSGQFYKQHPLAKS